MARQRRGPGGLSARPGTARGVAPPRRTPGTPAASRLASGSPGTPRGVAPPRRAPGTPAASRLASGRRAGAPARLAVLLSGRGSNFLALHEAIERGEVPAEIVLVLSNVVDAPGLGRARELGLPAVAVPSAAEPSRVAHEAKVLAALTAARAEWLCLAGYMRLLSPDLVARFRHRILNVHPSLLPAFPGVDAQRQALEHGVKVAGCTVHLVDEGLDSGPIVAQRAVEVAEDDDVASLSARILAEEHRAYPAALARLLGEPWRVEGRRLVFGGVARGRREETAAGPG